MSTNIMSIPSVYENFKNTARMFGLTSNSPLACEDHCIYDAGYSCTYCERYENTKYFKGVSKVLEEANE